LIGGGWLAWALYTPVAPASRQFVMLRAGYSTRRIAAELESAGVIRSANAFLLWRRLHPGRSLKAGEYLFEKPATALDVNSRLVRGDIYIRTVVVPEGFNMFEIAQAVQDAGLGPKEDFLKVATTNTNLIHDLSPEATTLEGYLFPNTYEFTRTQTATEMAGAMVKQFRLVANEIGLNTDVNDTVTMASIVEKETAVPEERTVVASVYANRVREHMPLQADPSVIYGEMVSGNYTGALHHNDMQFDSPYNTYRDSGLPPGPIANPGKAALEAAMHPASTEYLYFVADGSGRHRFARNLEEHNRNVAAYRKAVQTRE
jgi:UPF0755 protein